MISSLSVFAKVNNLGFIETPYRKVEKGVVNTKETIYLSAEEEENQLIAQSTVPIDKNGKIVEERVIARDQADFPVVGPEQINYTDVAPNQIASISASLIPFLEHDDANRALMGSNMMRQAVPLLRPESPIVGTGLERQVASDSRCLLMQSAMEQWNMLMPTKLSSNTNLPTPIRLFLSTAKAKLTILLSLKNKPRTCINLKPIVKGDKVKKGQVLSEGYATQAGELALGRNMKVAFMPWKGYNFENLIVISKEVVREDIFTSIHIDEYSLDVRDTN